MTTWAIVPVKPLVRSKSRLAGVLNPDERKSLSRTMLDHTLHVLTTCQAVENNVLVISRDPAVLTIARKYDINTVQESGSPELNAALTRASRVVSSRGAKRVLILPSDLPLLTKQDIEAILSGKDLPREVVVAPDRHEDGTNALLIQPPSLFEFAFGIGSFKRHLKRAAEAGASVREYRSPTIGLDVDLPEDLELYRATLATK